MLKIITTCQEFDDIRDKWNELFDVSSRCTAFQSWGYQRWAWDFLSTSSVGRLFIVCIVRQKDKLLQAVFPLYVDKDKTVRFINDRHSDFCDAIIHPDFENDYHIYEELALCLEAEKNIKTVCLDNLRPGSRLSSFLSYFLQGSLCYQSKPYSYINVPSCIEESEDFVKKLEHLTTKERYRLKNIIKKIGDARLTVYRKDLGSDFPDSQVNELIDQMIAAGIRSRDYFNEEFVNLFRHLYDENLLEVHVSSLEDAPVSANFYLKSNSKSYIDWIAIYKDGKYNLQNLLQTIEYISLGGGGEFNFARGLYEYKVHNFRPIICHLHTYKYSKGIGHWVKDSMGMNFYFAKQLVKRYINKK